MSRLHKNRIAVPKLFVTNNSRKHFSSRIFPKNLGWFVFENNKTTKTSSSIKTKEFDKSKWHIAPWRSQSDPFCCFHHKNLVILTYTFRWPESGNDLLLRLEPWEKTFQKSWAWKIFWEKSNKSFILQEIPFFMSQNREGIGAE